MHVLFVRKLSFSRAAFRQRSTMMNAHVHGSLGYLVGDCVTGRLTQMCTQPRTHIIRLESWVDTFIYNCTNKFNLNINWKWQRLDGDEGGPNASGFKVEWLQSWNDKFSLMTKLGKFSLYWTKQCYNTTSVYIILVLLFTCSPLTPNTDKDFHIIRMDQIIWFKYSNESNTRWIRRHKNAIYYFYYFR